MKLYTKVSLFIVVLLQLNSALGDFTKDKRHPLYDFIATKMNEYTVSELLMYGHVISEIWPQYTDAIASQSELLESADYQEFSKTMEHLIEAVKKLEEDKENCELITDVYEKMRKVFKTDSSAKWSAFDKFAIREKQMKTANTHNLKTKLNEIHEQLPAVIESFTQSLNDKELQQFKDLLEWCERYMAAKNYVEKYYFFAAISRLCPDEELEKDKYCKWGTASFKNFNQKATIYITDSKKVSNV